MATSNEGDEAGIARARPQAACGAQHSEHRTGEDGGAAAPLQTPRAGVSSPSMPQGVTDPTGEHWTTPRKSSIAQTERWPHCQLGQSAGRATHAAQGRALHVLQSLGKAKGQRYVGELTHVNHTVRRGPDREGNDRRIIVFHLVPVGRDLDEVALAKDEQDPVASPPRDLAEARRRALARVQAKRSVGSVCG